MNTPSTKKKGTGSSILVDRFPANSENFERCTFGKKLILKAVRVDNIVILYCILVYLLPGDNVKK